MSYNIIRGTQRRYKPQSDQLKDSVRSVSYFDSANIDPFGRLRVSSPFTLFDSKQLFDNQALFWVEKLTGSGSSVYDTNKSSSSLSINGEGSVVRQTRRYFEYQTGKGLLVLLTFTLGDSAENVTKRIGYFDEGNGVFVEQDSGGVFLCLRTNTTGTTSYRWRIPQSEWNVDKFDGYGKGAVKLDFSKSQIFFCDLEWLGVGRVRAGFVVDGKVLVAHEFTHANNISGVYMRTPNLPVRAEISGTGVGTIEQICSSVVNEGGVNISTFERSVDSGNTPLSSIPAGATLYPLISLRIKPGRKGASFKVARVEAIAAGTSTVRWSLLLNPTFSSSATFTDVENSNVQYSINTSSSVTITGGTQLESGYAVSSLPKGSGVDQVIDSFILPGFDLDGNSDVVVLAVQLVTGSNESVYGAIKWFSLI